MRNVLSSIKAALGRADPVFAALALGVYFAGVALVALRWRVVVGGVTGRRPPLGPLVLATFASSFVTNLTPAGRLGGEACRVAALARLGWANVSRATSAIAYERLSEVPAILSIAIATLVVVGRLPVAGVPSIWWIGLGGGTACVALARTRLARGWQRVRDRWQALESVAIAPSTLAAAVLISALVWTLDVVRLRLVAAAFHAPIGLAETATLTAVTIVAGLVPTIGGIGVVEGGLIAALIGFGVTPADAIAITVVDRSMTYGIAMLAGFGSLSLFRRPAATERSPVAGTIAPLY